MCIRDSYEGLWTVLSSVPSYVMTPSQNLIISVTGLPQVTAIRLNCTSACSIGFISVGFLPATVPPQISAPVYTEDGVYFGNTKTPTLEHSVFSGEFFSVSYTQILTPTNYTIVSSVAGVPLSWAVLGSTEGVTFTTLDVKDFNFLTPEHNLTFPIVSTTGQFSIFRFVCTSAYGPSCWISSFSVQGTQQGPAPQTPQRFQFVSAQASQGSSPPSTVSTDVCRSA